MGAYDGKHLFVGEYKSHDLSHTLNQSLGYNVEFVGRVNTLQHNDVGEAYHILEHLCRHKGSGPTIHSGKMCNRQSQRVCSGQMVESPERRMLWSLRVSEAGISCFFSNAKAPSGRRHNLLVQQLVRFRQRLLHLCCHR